MPVFVPGGGSGGSGGSSGPPLAGGSGGGGGGSSTRKKSPASQSQPRKDVVRALTRMRQASQKYPKLAGEFRQAAGQSLEGLTPAQIQRAGAKADLLPDDILEITQYARLPDQMSPGVVRALDVMDRPAQSVKGTLVEGFGGTIPNPLAAAKGAWRGVSGKEAYRGSEVAGVLALGQTKKEAKKWAKGLPAYASIPIDVGVDVVADPINWVTLGGGGLADDAARSVAKVAVGQSVKDAALSGPARDVYQNLLAKGWKGLATHERAVVESSFKGGKIPRELVRKVKRAPGGVRFAGHQVPGTRGMLRGVGPKAGGVGSSTEQFFRPDSAIRQVVRKGELASNVSSDVTNVQAQMRGSEFFAGLASKRAERGAEEALGRGLTGAKAGSRKAIRKGRNALDKNPEILDRVLRSLDVGGGKAAREALPRGEREMADFLSTLRHEDQVALEATGRIRSDAANVAWRAAPIPNKQAGRISRLIQKAQKASDAQGERLAAIQTETEFRNVPAIQRPKSGEFGPSHHIPADVKGAEQYGKALAKQQILDRRLRGLEQQLDTVRAKVPDAVPEDQYLYHLRDGTTLPPRGRNNFRGFLRNRKNRGTIAGNADYNQDPIVSMATHNAGTIRETAQIDAYRQLEEIAPGDKPLAFRGDDVVKGEKGKPAYSPKMEAFKEQTPDWEKNYVELTAPTLEGSGRIRQPVLVRKEIAPFYEKFAKAAAGDKQFGDGVKYLSALWAGYAVATPGFIVRNVLQGNLMLAYMADGLNPKVWAESLGTMKRMQRGIRNLGDPYAFIKPEELDLIRGALDNNAVESNFIDSLRDQSHASANAAVKGKVGKAIHAAKTNKYSPASTSFVPTAAIKGANQWAEGWSRLGLYATKIKQGYAPPEAAAIARKYMLDYKNLSPANDALRTVNPFLTWVYKVTPLVLRETVTDPRKIRIPEALLKAVDAAGSQDQQGPTSEWMAESGGVSIPGTQQKFIPSGPVDTANQSLAPLLTELQTLLGQRPAGSGHRKAAGELINAVGMGGPIGGGTKSAWEAATGTQVFTGRKIPPGTRMPNPIPGIGGTLPWEVTNTLNNLLPIMSRLATLDPKTEYDRTARARRLGSQVGGLTIFPNDKSAKDAELRRRLDELNTRIRQWRGEGKNISAKTPTVKKSTGSKSGPPLAGR